MEIELAEHAKDLDDKSAERKDIVCPFNNNKAGRAWTQGFVARNTGTFQEKYSLYLNCSFV
jgi:hypothetical protein